LRSKLIPKNHYHSHVTHYYLKKVKKKSKIDFLIHSSWL
jgi:hypothetical protein